MAVFKNTPATDLKKTTGSSVPNNLQLRFLWRNMANRFVDANYSYMKVSGLISNLANDIQVPEGEILPIPLDYTIITPETLTRIIEWCKKYNEAPYSTQEEASGRPFAAVDSSNSKPSATLEQDIETFMKMDHETLLTTLLGANYLHIQPLIDVGCKAIARTIAGKTAEEIRKIYNIHNDFTPEEEDQIRRENAWAEDR